MKSTIFSFLALINVTIAFAPTNTFQHQKQHQSSSNLYMAEEDAKAPMVTGEELELMLTEWDQPLVIDAYATW